MQLILEKIKPMNLDELLLAVDRLTRFKLPEYKYNRVFREIIAKYLISPKISFKEYDKLAENEIIELVEQILKYSLEELGILNFECELYKFVFDIEQSIYVINDSTKKLMQAKIPYEIILELANKRALKSLPKNLEFLNYVRTLKLSPNEIRTKYKTLFPIEKIVLAEGITEEILLPKLAQILDYDFEQNGVLVIPAGGKNQVAKDYLTLSANLKIPMAILLDADATEVAQKISNRLRKIDKLILIEKGEFEDILPLSLLKKAINYEFVNIFKIEEKDFSTEQSRVNDLEEIYRVNGLGEFKKADFAHNVNAVLDLKSTNYVSAEIKYIIEKIKQV